MPTPTALLDASVLYPAPLRDLLLHLAAGGLFHARWSDAIKDEWTRNLLEHRQDLRADQLERTRTLMNAAFPDATVTGFEGLTATLELPDPDDRHVLAAAVHCHAQVIVTMNLRDFPAPALAPYGIHARHLDELVCDLMDADIDAVVKAVAAHRRTLTRPPVSADELLLTLERQSLTRAAGRLREHAARL